MKRFLIILFALVGVHFSAFSQAGDLPAGYLGSVLNYSYGTQVYNYSFTPTTTGVDYVGFAFRQDPGFWTFTNPSVTAGSSSTNLLINGNLQYGGGLSVNTTNYGTQYIQAPSDWGVWYQTGIYPSAAGYWSPGQWYDGAVGSYDGIYQGINVRAGTTYHISFSLSGTNPSSNPSIEVGTYMGTCAAGTSIFTCVPSSNASMSAIAAPQATQAVGGAPAPVVPVVTPPSVAFTDLKFSRNQIADTQWNVGSCTNAGGTNCQIYSKNPGSTWNLGGSTFPSATQYIAFLASGDANYPWHMYLYNGDGSFASDLGIGRILSQGLGSDGHHYFFFSNANYNGTLFSTDWGMDNTAGVTINGTNNPTVPQTNTFASTGSTAPLAAGATGGSGSSAPTVTSTTTTDSVSTSTNTTTTNVTNQYTAGYNYSFTGAIIDTVTTTNTTPVTTTNYSDGTSTVSNGTVSTTTNTVETYTITPNQSLTPADLNRYRGTLVNAITINQPMGSANNAIQATQKGTGNDIEMTVSGVSNRVSANQGFTVNSIGTPSESTTISNNNFAAISVYGNNNNVTSQQTGLMNSTILGVTGNYNTVTSTQNGNNNQSYASINGNNTTTSVNQNGNSNISAITSMGPNNNITVGQTGNSNGALISVANQGGASTVNLLQQAITQGQTFVVQQTCTNGAGCSVSVQQNR